MATSDTATAAAAGPARFQAEVLDVGLHDCVSLGQPELGLAQSPVGSEEARIRLPCLLRLLTLSQPRTAVPDVFATTRVRNNNNQQSSTFTAAGGDGGVASMSIPDADSDYDALLEEAVQRLEDRAVQYREAEDLQVISCHLVPALAKPALARLAPLHAKKQAAPVRDDDYYFETTALAEFVTQQQQQQQQQQHYSTSSSKQNSGKKRRLSTGFLVGTHKKAEHEGTDDALLGDAAAVEGNADEDDYEDADILVDDDEEPIDSLPTDGLQASNENSIKKRRQLHRRQTSDLAAALRGAAAEDTPEFAVSKTILDLARLTLESLQQQQPIIGDSGMAAEDSIWASSSSTVASIMPLAPVLRHRHVATALCRANIPQAPTMIAHMGANCPAAVPSLLVGCWRATTTKISSTTSNSSSSSTGTVALATKAWRQLATLAPRETSRALALLRRKRRQDSSATNLLLLQLELLVQQQGDPIAVACFLIEHLSSEAVTVSSAAAAAAAAATIVERIAASAAVTVVPAPSAGAQRRPTLEMRQDTTTVNTTTLRHQLQVSPKLLGQTLECLTESLLEYSRSSSFAHCGGGRIYLLLRAYTRLLAHISLERFITSAAAAQVGVPLTASEATLCECLEALQQLLELLRQSATTTTSTATTMDDRTVSLLACAVVCTVSSLVALDCALKTKLELKFSRLLRDMLTLKLPPSQCCTSSILLARIACAIQLSDPTSLYDAVEEVLLFNVTAAQKLMTAVRDEAFVMRLTKLCGWAKAAQIDPTSMDAAASRDASLAIQLLQCKNVSTEERTNIAETLLKNVLLAVEGQTCASVFLQSHRAAEFVELATSHLLHIDDRPKIPLVLPMQIEKQAMKLKFSRSECESEWTEPEALFFVQLLYSLVFKKLEPDSPFAFDPRVLPLKEVYEVCERASESSPCKESNETFFSTLKARIDRLCPEVKRAQRVMALGRMYQWGARTETVALVQNKAELMILLRKSVAEPDRDPCGHLAEKAFMVARNFLCDADLFTAAASALLSRPHSPPTYFTYPMLYRDPLAILKCPISIWGRRGTRRIALVILMSLLETNEHFLFGTAKCDETREEFLSSRNEIVARSLLCVAASPFVKLDGSNYSCCLTSGCIRLLIARQRGLAATLIKQNLNETQLDWMIESVPELMEDATALGGVLTERTSLTVAERLVAADGVLRIVIAHGYRHVDESEALANAALSQLLAAFFLTVGPVGVPVNALVGEGHLDATQVSRKATFRMLKALQKVRGYRVRLKNECVLYLQKFAGMCKGEGIVGNIQAAVTNRQKNLLKELFDMTTKALDAMGSSI